MRGTKRRPLGFEALEALTLLSSVPVSPMAAIRQVGAAPLSVADVQALQQIHSGGQLELFLSEAATLFAGRPDVQQFAMMVIAGHQATDQQIANLELSRGLALSPLVQGNDQALGLRAIQAIASGQGFDQTYLTTMAQINGLGLAKAQQLAQSTDAQVQQLAQGLVTAEQSQFTAAQSLLAGRGLPGGMIVGLTLNPGSLTAADYMGLQTDYSMDNLEIFLSQAAALTSGNPSTQLYAAKLAADHTLANTLILQVAEGAGASIIPGLTPADQAIARQVFAAALTSGDFDRAYLSANVPIHQMAVSANQQLAASTQNPFVGALATNAAATSFVHLLAAQQLLVGGAPGNGGNGVVGHQNFQITGFGNGFRFGQEVFGGGRRFVSHDRLVARGLTNNSFGNGPEPNLSAAASLFSQELLSRFGSPTGGGGQSGGTAGSAGPSGSVPSSGPTGGINGSLNNGGQSGTVGGVAGVGSGSQNPNNTGANSSGGISGQIPGGSSIINAQAGSGQFATGPLSIRDESLQTRGKTIIFTMDATDGLYLYQNQFTMQIGPGRGGNGGPFTAADAASLFARTFSAQIQQSGYGFGSLPPGSVGPGGGGDNAGNGNSGNGSNGNGSNGLGSGSNT